MNYYPEPDSHSRNKVKVELDMSNNGSKSKVGKVPGVNRSDFDRSIDLASLKSTDLKKISGIAETELLKTVYDELAKEKLMLIIQTNKILKK